MIWRHIPAIEPCIEPKETRYCPFPAPATTSLPPFIRDDPLGVDITELEKGFVNFTFRVKSKTGESSVIVKHSTPYCKTFPEIVMPMERQEIEYAALLKFYQIKPGCCPQPYCYDKHRNIIAMEDLGSLRLMWEVVHDPDPDGELLVSGMKQLGELTASTHHATMRVNVSAVQWEDMANTYRNPFVDSVVKDFFFGEGVMDAGNTQIELLDNMKAAFADVVQDAEFRRRFTDMRQLMKSEECLVQNDCNERGVFMGLHRTAIFDLEFAGLGLRAGNVGLPLVPLVIIPYFMTPSQGHDKVKATFRTAFVTLLETYLKNMPDLQQEDNRGKIISEITGCLAIFVFRNVICTMFGHLYPNISRPPTTRAKVMRHMAAILKTHSTVTDLSTMTQLFFTDLALD